MKNQSTIIPVSTPNCQVNSWKILLKQAITDPLELLAKLELSADDLPYSIDGDNPFKVRVPEPYVAKMAKNSPRDPLLRQVLSVTEENLPVSGYLQDPLAEKPHTTPGILHKYHGRALMILAAACAVNCRYCFRRHFPYQDKMASGDSLLSAIEYIRNDSSLTEIILSGGDPLMVNDRELAKLVESLEAIPHLKRLRIHTRLPVVIPQRLTPELLNLLTETRLQSSMVLHINHANEIDPLFKQWLAPFNQQKIQLLNQSVLLRGVNDKTAAMADLSEALFTAGIIPYYIHLLDKVAGAAHFEVGETEALLIINQLRNRLPGYLVPRLAKEIPGEKAKSLLA